MPENNHKLLKLVTFFFLALVFRQEAKVAEKVLPLDYEF